VLRVLGVGEEVQVALVENQFVLRMPNFLLVARLIEGQFPNYEQVVPKGHPCRLVLSRSALTAALRRGLGESDFFLTIEGLDNRAGAADQRERLAPSLALLRSLLA